MKPLTVEEILNLKDKDEQRLAKIDYINNHNLSDVPLSIIPDVQSKDYFFVSYSHKDYKLVYTDVFNLHSCGLNIWYDKEMVIGDSWIDTANKFMVPRECLGVLFYFSEASLKSDPVIREINFAKKVGKHIVPISLPFVSDYKHNGESAKGKTYLPFEMIDILLENNVIDTEKADKLREFLSKEMIYLKYDPTKYFDNAKRIKDTIKKIPLLNISSDGVVQSISDTDAVKIMPADFTGNHKEIYLGTCAFANCSFLEEFHLTKKDNTDTSIEKLALSEFAFYQCKSLKVFDSGKTFGAYVPAHAFDGCVNLEVISPNRVKYVGERAFANCQKLKEISLIHHVDIKDEAFLNCKNLVRVINIDDTGEYFDPNEGKMKISIKDTKPIKSIGRRAFMGCESLEYFEVPRGISSIKVFAFAGCKKLREIKIHHGVKDIQSSAFLGCDSLSKIDISSDHDSFALENEAVLFNKDHSVLYKVLPSLKYSFEIPKETKTIDTYAFAPLKNKPYIGVNNKNQKFELFKGGIVDKEHSRLFFLNYTKNGFEVLRYVNRIQPFALDLFLDVDTVPIYENMHSIGEYVYYSFKKIKVIDLYSETVELNKLSFDYSKGLEKLICHSSKFDSSEFKLFTSINEIEFTSDTVYINLLSDEVRIDTITLNSRNAFISGKMSVRKVIIGKSYAGNKNNLDVIINHLVGLEEIEVNPENTSYEIRNGKIELKIVN